MYLTSAHNPKIRQALALRDRRDRDVTGLFLIEGFREISRAQPKVIIEHVVFCPKLFLGTNEPDLLEKCRLQGAQLFEVPPHIFEKVSYRDRPDGLLAIAQKMNTPLSAIQSKNPFLIIAEALEKPGNLGTIIRSCDAAGVDGVIVANRCTDIYNPNVVRASVGTLFTIPVIETSNEEALAFCMHLNLSLMAATPEGSVVYTDAQMRGPLGIVVGTEQLGVSSFWKKACHQLVSIPMRGVADSLNVATATTIFLFEAVRQRASL